MRSTDGNTAVSLLALVLTFSPPGLRAGFAPLFEKRVALRRLSTFLAPFSEKGRSGRGA
jgi:hypothetical protein